MDELKLLGKRIQELRKNRHQTQEELAAAAGLYFKFLGRVERGDANPTLKVLKKIAGALEVSVADLFHYAIQASDPKQTRKQLANDIKRCSDSEVLLLQLYLQALRHPRSGS